MERKEHKIGEAFQCGFITLKCEKSTDSCDGCFFNDVCSGELYDEIIEMAGPCFDSIREDQTDVIFRKVK